MKQLEQKYQYLEATYETLIPGEKRENRNKMENCRKEYQELRQNFLQHTSSVETQRNKEQLVYTTTSSGANFKAQADVREKLLGTDNQLYEQDEQLNNIKKVGLATININNETSDDLKRQRYIIESINEKNQLALNSVEKTGSVVGEMTRKEFMMKIYIGIAVVLLFIVDLFILLFHNLKL